MSTNSNPLLAGLGLPRPAGQERQPQRRRWWATRLALAGLSCLGFLTSCAPAEPVRIGLLASLSGSNADLGEAGRNGAQLAVEDVMAAAGPGAAGYQLVVQDDRTDILAARAATQALIDQGARVIIGPFSTAMAEAALPVCEERRVLLFSPSVSALKFVGQDDLFLRMNSSTRDNAGYYAAWLQQQRQAKAVVLLVDTINATFGRSWANEFLAVFPRGQARAVEFNSAENPDYTALLDSILAGKPDTLLFVANSVVSARLVQHLRKAGHATYAIAAEWAGTQQLIELSGKAGEGMEVLHIYDTYGTQPDFINFVNRYQARFMSAPSYSSILAWEATRLTIQALDRHPELRQPATGQAEALRDAIIRDGPYQGLQDPISFDRYGDSQRRPYFMRIEDGVFKRAE